MASDVLPSGRRLNVLSGGCFVHPGYKESWCANIRQLWWEGFVVLDNVKDGDSSISFVRSEDIRGIGASHYSDPTRCDFGRRTDKSGVYAVRSVAISGRRKLTEDDVRYIRRSTERPVDLAKRFGINPSTVAKVRNRKRHKHVV